MPIIQDLSPIQIHEALSEALRREAPLAVTCCIDNSWYSMRSRILQLRDADICLEYPSCEGEAPELSDSTPIGLSFKIKHHKHLFNALIEEACERTDGGEGVEAIRIAIPRRMQRVQRRAYHRVEIPRNRSPLATFWEGGLSGANAGASGGPFSWEGWLTNISAGGFQIRLSSRHAPQLDVGDVVGVRLDMGQGYTPIEADVQFRHEASEEEGVALLGFQFVGLGHSHAGRETLQRVGRIVCEFQRIEGRRRARSSSRQRHWREPKTRPSRAG